MSTPTSPVLGLYIGLSTSCYLPPFSFRPSVCFLFVKPQRRPLHFTCTLTPTSFRDPDMCQPGRPPERQQPLQCEVGYALPGPAGWGWLQPQGGGGQQLAERIGQPGAGGSLQCPRCEPGGRPLYPAVVPRVSVQSWTALLHRRRLTSGVSPHLWMRRSPRPINRITCPWEKCCLLATLCLSGGKQKGCLRQGLTM